MSITKQSCPINRIQFQENAQAALSCSVDGKEFNIDKREFSTGGLGYYGNLKLTLIIGGVRVPCTVAVTVSASNSKELPR